MTVYVGDREIIEQGTAIISGEETVQIKTADLTFDLFFEDSSGGELDVRSEGEGKSLAIYFDNFNNPLGTAWFSEVGTFKDRALILSIFVLTITQSDRPTSRLLNFTLSLRAKK